MKKIKKKGNSIFEFYKKYALIIMFIILLVVPILSHKIVGKYIETGNSENRKLANKPEFDLERISDYPELYDNYFNDHIPYRSILRKTWASIHFELFEESLTSKVVVGKNEGNTEKTWLFYNELSDGETVEEARGITTFSREYQENVLKKIKSNTEKMKSKNIDLYYVVVPNKENVYKDKLPDWVKIIDKASRTDKLADYLVNENDVNNLIYLKKDLELGKEKFDTYYRGDTHWNYYGSYLGANRIIKTINPEYRENENPEIKISEKLTGDLISFTNLEGLIKDCEYEVEFYPENVYSSNEKSSGNYKIVMTNCENAVYDKRLLIIGDSFRTALIPYISRVYKNVIYVHIDEYKKSYIDEYSPDVVIVERVERNVKDIGTLNVY